MKLDNGRESANIEDRRGEKVGAIFPLPAGCRNVCRPKRTKVRHFTIRALVRVVESLFANGVGADEVCSAMMLFPQLAKHCKPDCGELREIVDGWLREFEAVKEHIGILDEFFNDLWPFQEEGGTRLMRLKGGVVSRVKWLLWLFRAYSLLKSIKEVVNFIDATHLVLQDISRALDALCGKEENDLGLGPVE